MKIQFTFKHMDSSEALSNLVEAKLNARLDRYSSRPLHTHVTFSIDGLMQKVHVTLITADGHNIEADDHGSDMYAVVDSVADKLDAQLRRHKERLKSHKGESIRRLASLGADGGTSAAVALEEPLVESEDVIDAADILNFESRHPPLAPVCGD